MGVAHTAKVITASCHWTSRVWVIQPGNREWVTVIECINASGWPLPPMIIFSGKVHQSQWYQDINPDWLIGLSDNGWTNNDLGVYGWKRSLKSILWLVRLGNIGFWFLMAMLAMNQQSLIFSARIIKSSLFICLLIHLINCNLLMLAALHP